MWKPHFMLPQTKILEGGTKDEMQMFDTFFEGSWPKMSTHTLENVSNICISSFVPPSKIGRGVITRFGLRNAKSASKCTLKRSPDLPKSAFGGGYIRDTTDEEKININATSHHAQIPY